MRTRTAPIGLLALVASACAPAVASQVHESDEPALVVLITIDQLRADYLDRWAGQLTGGLGRLAREGALYTNAVHDHAVTETAPGHATIGSGRFPVNNGIARNTAGVSDPNAALIGFAGAGAGASPHRFRGTTIADWLVDRHPDARVLSVSVKDRGAILPIGRRKADVYWLPGAGVFTTSTYYRDTLPTWVRQFNARQLPQRHAGYVWNLLLPESAYPEPDSVPVENGGVDFVFPHRVSTDSAIAAAAFLNTPGVDEVTLAFALAGVRTMRLGARNTVDLLAISLSGMDFVGHRYGPDSREIHDYALRVDRALGTFLDSLFTVVDRRRVLIALSSDHGVAPYPELSGGRRVDVAPLRQLLRTRLAAAGTDSMAIALASGALDVNWDRIRADNVDISPILRDFAAAARAIPGVARVSSISELARADTVNDHIARRWLHMFASDEDSPLVMTLDSLNYGYFGPAATHGTPWDYDARVPVILWGSSVRAGRRDVRVRTVDIAPTLAKILGLTPSERVDGHALDAAP